MAFENGKIISELIRQSGSFVSLQQAERVFTNRYGVQIYEDILIARCTGRKVAQLEQARTVGIASLKGGKAGVSEKNRPALMSAIAMAGDVQPSPILSISVPASWVRSTPKIAMSHASN